MLLRRSSKLDHYNLRGTAITVVAELALPNSMEKYRKDIRLKHYDYSTPGAYFVTICTNFKKDLIGEEEQEIINKELELLEQRFPSIKVDYFTVMPDHIHLILIFKKGVVSLPQVIQAFKSLSTRKIKEKGYSRSMGTLGIKNYPALANSARNPYEKIVAVYRHIKILWFTYFKETKINPITVKELLEQRSDNIKSYQG